LLLPDLRRGENEFAFDKEEIERLDKEYRDCERKRFVRLILRWQTISPEKHNVGALYDVLWKTYHGRSADEVFGDLKLEENEGSYEFIKLVEITITCDLIMIPGLFFL